MTANIHPGSESGTCFRTNDTHETGPPKSEQLHGIDRLAFEKSETYALEARVASNDRLYQANPAHRAGITPPIPINAASC